MFFIQGHTGGLMKSGITFQLLIYLLIFFSQSTYAGGEEYSKRSLMVKFKSSSQINFNRKVSKLVFNNSVVDSILSTCDLKKIKRLGKKRNTKGKQRKTFLLKFKQDQDIHKLIKSLTNTGFFYGSKPIIKAGLHLLFFLTTSGSKTNGVFLMTAPFPIIIPQKMLM